LNRHLVYEHYQWFHHQIQRGRFPNAGRLAVQFELSGKTAQRAIEFMRDRLCAPLRYDAAKRGYRYEDDSYELPPVWVRADELASLLISFRLAATIPDPHLKAALRSLLDRFLRVNAERRVSLADLEAKVSIKNVEYARVDGATFHRVFDALLTGRSLRIDYLSPYRGAATTRDVLPLHLLSYMGNWHLIAYCDLRRGLRDFALARIRRVEPCPREVGCAVDRQELKEYLRRDFGIMNGPARHQVTLRFRPAVARFVTEQVWHPDQQMEPEADGSLCLSFPVADFREIRREVLKFGADVEVLAPDELRREVQGEIEKMKSVYR